MLTVTRNVEISHCFSFLHHRTKTFYHPIYSEVDIHLRCFQEVRNAHCNVAADSALQSLHKHGVIQHNAPDKYCPAVHTLNTLINQM